MITDSSPPHEESTRREEARPALAHLGIPTVTLAVAFGLLLAAGHARENVIVLVDPEQPIEDVWELQSFGKATRYRIREIDGRRAIEALGRASAAGLFRDLRFTVIEHPIVEWAWRVDRLPKAADIRSSQADDFGASLYFLFGRPGLLRPEPPTLAYAWTSEATPESAIVASPRHPARCRSSSWRAVPTISASGSWNSATWSRTPGGHSAKTRPSTSRSSLSGATATRPASR